MLRPGSGELRLSKGKGVIWVGGGWSKERESRLVGPCPL